MSLPKLNPVEPPWYGPVCPVVGEGWHREVSPYPDQLLVGHPALFDGEIMNIRQNRREPPKLIEDSTARCAANTRVAEELFIALSRFRGLQPRC